MGPIRGHKGGRTRPLAALLAGTLVPVPALAAPGPVPDPTLIAGAVAIGAVALAVAAGLWALAEQRAANRLRRTLKGTSARARAAAGARDALISAGREALIVWGRDGTSSYSYGGGEQLLESCLAGADATMLSQAIDALADNGTPFDLITRDRDGRRITLRGRAVGSMAAIWLEPEAAEKTQAVDFRAVLDALPIPVWLRDKALTLAWGNRAFLAETGAGNVEAAVAAQHTLDKSERDLAATARSERRTTDATRFCTVAGQRRELAFTHAPLETGGIVGSAIDITDISAAETRLRKHVEANTDTLNKLATAVAIFDRDQHLEFYNRAFARLWELPEAWLNTHPTDGEILDRLREARRLPEQRDYRAWKRARLELYGQRDEYMPEDLWHLPGGKTLRVVAQRHPFGGLTFLYEDVTEKLELESEYNTLSKVQSATLDTLQEGVAVFGPDGKLKLHNAAFARLWELEPALLESEPHMRRIAEACIGRFGEQDKWQELIASISSGSERRREWGQLERSDRTILSVSLAPLPDGATLVSFADITDRSRIESALRERNEALIAADRLKSDFIHHASFLFRDPLNAVHGFAELLATGSAGPLNERQEGYVQDILTASTRLAEVTSDILDLALIDSGAMRLELARVDLSELLEHVTEPFRRHAESLDIQFTLDCAPEIGVVMVDQKRIRQVVFNLLSNAFKYTPRGGAVTLGATVVGDDVQIFVADTGPGIAPEVKANVFERFAAKGQNGSRAGAGLGLALVNRFIELHDGWVEVDTSHGAGTLVRCHLPRRVPEGEPPSREASVA